jgi:hypothetical protein
MSSSSSEAEGMPVAMAVKAPSRLAVSTLR